MCVLDNRQRHKQKDKKHAPTSIHGASIFETTISLLPCLLTWSFNVFCGCFGDSQPWGQNFGWHIMALWQQVKKQTTDTSKYCV